MKRRSLLAVFATSALGCQRVPHAGGGGARLVSLSPGITDALFEIGAGAQVVARSDYCDYPPEVTRLPRVGTSLTPAYETITRLAPTLIIGEAGANARKRDARGHRPHAALKPWLHARRDRREPARARPPIAPTPSRAPTRSRTELHDRLAVPARPQNGPRVLLVIGYQPGKLEELWFIRENSLHGAALHAAGARNAVPEAVTGLPRLSLERLLSVDPDAIFVLTQPGHAGADYLTPFRALGPLRAVREGHLLVIEAPEAYVHGPRILALVGRLASAVARLGKAT